MEELLKGRLDQLREIDQRLETIQLMPRGMRASQAMTVLRADLAVWIKEAAEEYDAF